MATRLTPRPIQERLRRGRHVLTIDVPNGTACVQAVIDRRQFEVDRATTDDEIWIVSTRWWAGQHYLGGAWFTDFKRDMQNARRPGQRMIWSYSRTDKIPRALQRRAFQLTLEIDALVPFDAEIDIDFFTVEEVG